MDKKYFCKKCVKGTEEANSLTLCERRIENHGFTCEEYDLSAVVEDFPEIKRKMEK